jgi:hypothetical protein
MVMEPMFSICVPNGICIQKHDTCVQCVVDIHNLQSYQTGVHKVIFNKQTC